MTQFTSTKLKLLDVKVDLHENQPLVAGVAVAPPPPTMDAKEHKGHHRRLACTGLYCSILFVQGSCVNIIGPASPMLAARLHASLEDVGSVLAAEGAGAIIGAAVLAHLLERYPGHIIIGMTSTILCACLCAIAFLSTTIAQVAVLYLCVGASLGCLSGVSNTLITWAQTGRNVGPWVNLVNASFGCGSSGVPLFFFSVERATGDGMLAFASIGVLAAANSICSAMLRSPSQPPVANDTAYTGSVSNMALEHDERSRARGSSTVCGIDLGSRATYVDFTVVMPLMAVMTLGIGGEIAFGAWLYPFATHRVGMVSSDAALLNSMYWCAFTLGRIGTIPLAAFLPPEYLLLPTIALETSVALVMLGYPGSALVLWFATIGAGLGVCALYSNVVSLLASYNLLSPRAVSLLQLACGVGHMTVPKAVALVMRHSSLGHDALFAVLAVTNALCLAIVACVVGHLRRNFKPAKGSLREARLSVKRRV